MSGLFLQLGLLVLTVVPRRRSPVNINGSLEGDAIGFIDGDFVERFLQLPKGSVEIANIMKGGNVHETLKVSYEDIIQALEHVQLLH